MSRTGRVVAALFAAGGVLAVTGCGATDRVAASVDGTDISVDEFDRFTEALVALPNFASSYDAGSGDVDAGLARSVLSLLITNQVAEDVLDANGEAVTEDDRAEVVGETGDPALDQLPDDVRNAVIDSQARATALTRIEVAGDQQQAAYEDSPISIGTFCIRHILSDSEAAAEDVLTRLEAGEDFATLAAEVSIDPSAATNGGTLASQTGASCMITGEAQQTFDATFYDAAIEAVPGSFVGPVPTAFGWHVIEAIPYDEVTDDIAALFDQYGGLMLYEGAVRTADVGIDPRFGTWDTASLSIVPLQ